jgi:hypothetical protein
MSKFLLSFAVEVPYKLRVFENRVLRRIFGPKRDGGMGEWIQLHNRELHNLYSSPHIIRQIQSRRMRWVGHVACMEEERKVFEAFFGKPKAKRSLRRLRHRWEDGIWETSSGGLEWIHLSPASGYGLVVGSHEHDEPL